MIGTVIKNGISLPEMLLGDTSRGSKTLEGVVIEPSEICIGKEKAFSYDRASGKANHPDTLFCPSKKGTTRSTQICKLSICAT